MYTSIKRLRSFIVWSTVSNAYKMHNSTKSTKLDLLEVGNPSTDYIGFHIFVIPIQSNPICQSHREIARFLEKIKETSNCTG